MKVSVCRNFRERRWSQYYEPRDYHPIGMTHVYAYCVKGSLTRMVTAIKEAREARPSEADAKKNEMMVICTAIARKLGGNTNAEN